MSACRRWLLRDISRALKAMSSISSAGTSIQQIFAEYLLCAKHWCKCLRYISEQNECRVLLWWELISRKVWEGQLILQVKGSGNTVLVLSYCPSSTICCLGNLGRFFDFLKSQFSHLYNGRTRPIYFIDGSVQWDNMSKALGKETRVHIH